MQYNKLLLFNIIFFLFLPKSIVVNCDENHISQRINTYNNINKYYLFEYYEKQKLTINNLYNEIINNNIKYPDIVLSQAILECGWGLNSYKSLKYNNIFGFQVSSKQTLVFHHWKDCVKYYAVWQEKYFNELLYENYYVFLDNYKYAEDTLYIQKLKSINRRLKNNYFFID